MTGLITLGAARYGTAAQIVTHLRCPDLSEDLIRSWARRGRIRRYHRPGPGRGHTWYALEEVVDAELATRTSGRGRRRHLALAA
jgi:hypothetical protein